nr:MAG TPA: hypothetical protein [Caudoviricetes sp.]
MLLVLSKLKIFYEEISYERSFLDDYYYVDFCYCCHSNFPHFPRII